MTNTSYIPFGLSFRVPLPPDARQTGAATAVMDQQRRIPTFTGRPLSEQTIEDTNPPSFPTENDGKDPISVDSDPFYD